MKTSYLKPEVFSANDLILFASTQSGLGLESCDQDPCPGQGTYTLSYYMCVEGISDASLFSDASKTEIIYCPGQGEHEVNTPFSNCRTTNDFSCPIGSMAVICDVERDCEGGVTTCDLVNTGVTYNGQFVECPGFKKI